jgi:hypothetical protein
MANYAFNCSFEPLSAQYAYNPSSSAADALQVCYRLLRAKCMHLGLDASFCENSQSSATGDTVLAMSRDSFCANYYNTADAYLSIVFGSLILIAFFLNACCLIVRRSRPQAARAPDSALTGMSMIDPLAESSLFIPAAPHHAPPPHSDSLGICGRLLPFVGLQWLRAPKASPSRQALRVVFLLCTVASVVPLCVQYQRLYLARFNALTFVITFNKCSSLCSSSLLQPCPRPYNISFNCASERALSDLSNYLECFDAGKVDVLVQSGLAVQLLLLLLPLHSAASCPFFWPRPSNPVLLALHALRQLSPDRHRQCCASAAKFIGVLSTALTLLSVLSSQILNRVYTCTEVPCPALNKQLYIPKLFCDIVIYAFLCLTPTAAVSLFVYTAFIVRLRVRSFVCLAEFVCAPMLLRDCESKASASARPPVSKPSAHGESKASASARPPVSKPSAHDVVTALHLLRCPHSALSQCTALLRAGDGTANTEAAAAVQGQLRLLWTMQLRDIQLLANFGRRWLLVQATFALIILFPIASFLSLASQYSSLIAIVLPILQLYLLFCVPFVAALLALAIGNFYVQHACSKLSLLLQRCSEAAERDAAAFASTFNQHDSISDIVTFCRFTSHDAFCLYGVQINWLSLARFVYYMGLLVWVLSTSIIGFISTGFAPKSR